MVAFATKIVGRSENIAQLLRLIIVTNYGHQGNMRDVNSVDKSLMEKLRLMEALNDEERKTIYTMRDAFIGKKKLKDAIANVLHDMHYQ